MIRVVIVQGYVYDDGKVGRRGVENLSAFVFFSINFLCQQLYPGCTPMAQRFHL
jgi:hypothetical protein